MMKEGFCERMNCRRDVERAYYGMGRGGALMALNHMCPKLNDRGWTESFL